MRPAFRVLSRLVVLVPFALPGSAAAWPAAVIGGFDYVSRGPDATTRAALAGGVARLGMVEATAVGMRFDDSAIGMGSGVTAGLAVPIAPVVLLQFEGSRFLGDDGYGSWRARVGPRLDLPGGASARILWSHEEDNRDVRSDGVALESSAPLVAGLAARVNGAAGHVDGGAWSEALSGGLAWSAVPHLQLIGDVGVAGNAGSAFSTPGAPPLLGLLPRGGGRNGTTPAAVTSTFLLGMRVTLP